MNIENLAAIFNKNDSDIINSFENTLTKLKEVKDSMIQKTKNESEFIKNTKGRLRSIKKQLSELIGGVTKMKDFYNNKQRELETNTTDITKKTEEINTLQQEKTKLISQINDLNNRINQLDTDKNALNTEKDNEKTELTRQLNELKEELSKNREELANGKEELKKLREEHELLKQKVIEATKTINDVTGALTNIIDNINNINQADQIELNVLLTEIEESLKNISLNEMSDLSAKANVGNFVNDFITKATKILPPQPPVQDNQKLKDQQYYQNRDANYEKAINDQYKVDSYSKNTDLFAEFLNTNFNVDYVGNTNYQNFYNLLDPNVRTEFVQNYVKVIDNDEKKTNQKEIIKKVLERMKQLKTEEGYKEFVTNVYNKIKQIPPPPKVPPRGGRHKKTHKKRKYKGGFIYSTNSNKRSVKKYPSKIKYRVKSKSKSKSKRSSYRR